MRSLKYVQCASAVLALTWTLLPATAGATGIVLTGGNLTLDFADPSIGGNSTTLDRLDSLTWSGGSGAIAGQNLVANSGASSCNGDPNEFFGQSYGEPEGTYPLIVWEGATATLSNQTSTSMTSTTTGVITCSCGSSTPGTTPTVTTYDVFPAGNPNVNEARISRTIEFSSATPIYNGTNGVRGYVPRLPDGTYDTVLIPNAAGTAINTMHASSCPLDCEVTDWNGQWYADDNGSGTGMVVFRDSSSTSPAIVAVNYDQASNSNLTSIILLQPGAGWTAPVTETEWLCFYDPTTWTSAQRSAGTLPTGCAQQAITTTPAEAAIAFTPNLSATPGSVATSNTVQMSGISAGTPIAITGGEYSINGGAYTAAAGTVNNGDYVTVQVTASATACATTSASVTIGGVTSQFSVTTPASGTVSLALGISPGKITLGQQAVLTWSTANATSCTASGGLSGSEAVSGTAIAIPTAVGLQTYTLTCTGVGTATATVNLIVVAGTTPAPTVTLTASPTSVMVNRAISLMWSSTNATNCTDSGAWSGGYAPSGSESFLATTAGTQSYTITCTGAGGSATATATVTVTAAATPAPTVTIAVAPTSVSVGDAASLTWSSTNATACTASGAWTGTEATSGTASEKPTAAGSQVFTLTCTGAGGSANASATLAAVAAPTVTIAVTPTTLPVGAAAELSWSSTNATACTASGAWSGSEPVSGSMSETTTTAGVQTFTLTCTGTGGSANASANLTATQTVVTGGGTTSTASGRIGGGGALDLASLAGLVMLAGVARRPKRLLPVSDAPAKAQGRSTRLFVVAALGCALCIAALPGHAADEFGFDWQHSYVGVRAGESIYQPTTSYLLNSVGAGADEVQNLSINAHQFGGVIYAGTPIWRNLNLEVGYAQIGQFPLSMTTTTTSGGGSLDSGRANFKSASALHAVSRPGALLDAGDVDALAQAVVNAAPAAGHGVTLGFAMPFDITSRLSVEPRFAALAYQSKQSLSTSDATLRHDSTGAGFDGGVALSWRVGGPIFVGASVDCFHEDRGCNVVLVSGQIEYRFGRQEDHGKR